MVNCRFPSACWYARNIQKQVKQTSRNSGLITDASTDSFEIKLQQLQNRNERLIQFLEGAPPLNPTLEKTSLGRIYNLVTEVPEPFVKASSIAFGNELLLKLAAKSL